MEALTQLLTDEFSLEALARFFATSYTRRGALAELSASPAHAELVRRLDAAGLVDAVFFTLLEDAVSETAAASLPALRSAWGVEPTPSRRARVAEFWLAFTLAGHDSGRRSKIVAELRERAGDPNLDYKGHERDERGKDSGLWLRLRTTKAGLEALRELRGRGKLKRAGGSRITSDPITPARSLAALALRYRQGEREFPGLALKGQALAQLKLDGLIAPGVDLRGATLAGVGLSGADLRDAKLKRARVDASALNGASMKHANLASAVLQGCALEGASLRGVEMEKVELTRCDLARCDLRGVYAPGSRLQAVSLLGADLRYIDLERASLESVDMTRADLRTSSFEGARLRDVTLKGADLRGSDIDEARRE